MNSYTKKLCREDVLKAIDQIDAGASSRWGSSKRYNLIYKKKVYAPKEVLGIAICIAEKIDEWDVGDFSGGSFTNNLLSSFGFKIVLRNPGSS